MEIHTTGKAYVNITPSRHMNPSHHVYTLNQVEKFECLHVSTVYSFRGVIRRANARYPK